jgi:hypothetical protein
MIRGLKNASLAGRDEWPKNVTDAYNYLSKWEGDEPNGRHERDYEESSFLNDQEKVTQKEYPKVPQAWHEHMTCRKCHKKCQCTFPRSRVKSTTADNSLLFLPGLCCCLCLISG